MYFLHPRQTLLVADDEGHLGDDGAAEHGRDRPLHIASQSSSIKSRGAKDIKGSGFAGRLSGDGCKTKLDTVRRLIVPASAYIIYYKFDGDGVEILEIFDGRQEAPRNLPEDPQ